MTAFVVLAQTAPPTAGDVVAWDPNPSASRQVVTVAVREGEQGAAETASAFAPGTVIGAVAGSPGLWLRRSEAAGQAQIDTVTIAEAGTGYAEGDTGVLLPATTPSSTYTVTGVEELTGAVTELTVVVPDAAIFARGTQEWTATTETGGEQPGTGEGLEITVAFAGDLTDQVAVLLTEKRAGAAGVAGVALVRGPARVRGAHLSTNSANALFAAAGIQIDGVNGGSF